MQTIHGRLPPRQQRPFTWLDIYSDVEARSDVDESYVACTQPLWNLSADPAGVAVSHGNELEFSAICDQSRYQTVKEKRCVFRWSEA